MNNSRLRLKKIEDNIIKDIKNLFRLKREKKRNRSHRNQRFKKSF